MQKTAATRIAALKACASLFKIIRRSGWPHVNSIAVPMMNPTVNIDSAMPLMIEPFSISMARNAYVCV